MELWVWWLDQNKSDLLVIPPPLFKRGLYMSQYSMSLPWSDVQWPPSPPAVIRSSFLFLKFVCTWKTVSRWCSLWSTFLSVSNVPWDGRTAPYQMTASFVHPFSITAFCYKDSSCPCMHSHMVGPRNDKCLQSHLFCRLTYCSTIWLFAGVENEAMCYWYTRKSFLHANSPGSAIFPC